MATGYTPVTQTLTDSQTYTVLADSYGSCQFSYWLNNGSTDPLSIDVTSNTNLVAVYNCAIT